MYFRNYRLSKTWLDQYLKRAISEDPSTVNMVNGQSTCIVANVFPKLQTDKNLVRPLSKSAVSEHPSTVNIVNGP